jgi:hypothetical protein
MIYKSSKVSLYQMQAMLLDMIPEVGRIKILICLNSYLVVFESKRQDITALSSGGSE